MAYRTIPMIRPGIMDDDLVKLAGSPTAKTIGRSRTSKDAAYIWEYRQWPSCAAYVYIDTHGLVVAVRYVPT
ncbi:MAG: hypothetical protein ABFD47_05595 [Armatimonadota bacterium]